jgi:hypothetical protein
MRHKPLIKATIDDSEVELTNELIQKYKKDTNKVRVTKKGIEKFFNNFIKAMKNGF